MTGRGRVGKLGAWNRTSSGARYLEWSNPATGQKLWVYPHTIWDINPRTGMTRDQRITHWTVRSYNQNSGRIAEALEGRTFRNKPAASRFARRFMKRTAGVL